MTTLYQPDEEMKDMAIASLEYANSYLNTFRREVEAERRRFDNDLLYNLACISFEKYFVGLLARYDWNATNHLPLRMFREAKDFETELTESMKSTAILIGSFEAICSIDGFGYRTPTNEDLKNMLQGLEEVRELVEKRIAEIRTEVILEKA